MKFVLDNTPHTVNDLETILQELPPIAFIKNNKKQQIANIPCAFDIETSSFYEGTEKRACMYVWQFGIAGKVILGRTWGEFLQLCQEISIRFNLNENKKILVYVHNLEYEFQFLRHYFRWIKVFSMKKREPIYALCDLGIEFRCSYLLSGYSLKKLGEELHTYPVEKLSGDLDYNLIRHNKTPLTEKEIRYCVNDVLVVMAYIQEEIERNGGNIHRIPLTKTGYVRNYVRTMCLYAGNKGHRNRTKEAKKHYQGYKRLMENLTLTADEYFLMRRAFQGGFTHASARYSGKIVHDVDSFDFTSSYPYVMLSEKFPMGRGTHIEEVGNDFSKYINLYCCVFDIELHNIQSRYINETPLSASKCWKLENAIENNGRVYSADLAVTSVTDVDYKILKRFYSWDETQTRIANFWIYPKNYLPLPIIEAVLNLYQNKTELKGVEGKEVEYLRSKELLNSSYGMMVTSILREIIEYKEDWETPSMPNADEALEKYNHSRTRFLYYPWGSRIYVTAYARRNLLLSILNFGNDYVYSDTDSIKCTNVEKHLPFILCYNKMVERKLYKMAEHYSIDPQRFKPKNNKGEEKLIGIWDWETRKGSYKRFMTLGAKRYMLETASGDYSITVSGINKTSAMPYLISKFGDPFKGFNDDLSVPGEYTGKLTHSYLDEPISGQVEDYRENVGRYAELSAIHMEPASYTMNLAEQYKLFLSGMRWK